MGNDVAPRQSAFKLDVNMHGGKFGLVDTSKPLIERDVVQIWDRWWLPAGIGGASFVLALSTATQGVRPQPWQMGLVTFGILVGMLDGFGSYRVILYGTMQGPQERQDEANARLFLWKRARWRYAFAFLLSAMTAVGLTYLNSDEIGIAVVLGPIALYSLRWGFDLVRSMREAARLFPPGGGVIKSPPPLRLGFKKLH